MADHGGILHKALSEVHRNIPSTVRRAKVKGKKKRKMLLRIAFEKARERGANISKPK